MPRLRIFLNLEKFYNDHRKFVKIYLPGHVKVVSDLENYIGQLFDIKQKFILYSSDAYVHAAQKIHVFEDLDVVMVVPINQSNIHSDSTALENHSFIDTTKAHSQTGTPATQKNVVLNEMNNDVQENKVKQDSLISSPIQIKSHIVLTPNQYSPVQVSGIQKSSGSLDVRSFVPKPTKNCSGTNIVEQNGSPIYPRKYTRYELIDFEGDVAAKLKMAKTTSLNNVTKNNEENMSQLDLQKSVAVDSTKYTHKADSCDEKITSLSAPAITEASTPSRNETRKRKRTRNRKSKNQVQYDNDPPVNDDEKREKECQKHIRFDDLDTDMIECDAENRNAPVDFNDDTGIFQSYPTLNRDPRVGDILAFKKLKLSDDMTPVLSDYIVGEVTHVNPFKIIFKITEGENQLQHPTASDPDYDETTNLYHCSKTWLKVVKFIGEGVPIHQSQIHKGSTALEHCPPMDDIIPSAYDNILDVNELHKAIRVDRIEQKSPANIPVQNQSHKALTSSCSEDTFNTDNVKITSASSPTVTKSSSPTINKRKRKRIRSRKPKIHKINNDNVRALNNSENRVEECPKHIKFDDECKNTIDYDADGEHLHQL